MAGVIWTPPSAADLIDIRTYIAGFDPDTARDIARRLVEAADSLCDFPRRGRPAADGSRELVTVPPFVIRYRVLHDTVYILRIRHGRQKPVRRP